MRLWLKVLVVLGMTLAVLVPLTMVRGVINERQQYRAEAVATVARSNAGQQSFAGPVLVVPFRETVEVEEADANGVLRTVKRVRDDRWTFFPDELAVTGDLEPGMRRSGLYEVPVYEWEAVAQATFEIAIPSETDPSATRRVGVPYLSYAIGDVRGLIGSKLEVDGRPVALEQGQGYRNAEGVHVLLPGLAAGRTHRIDTRLQFTLAGTERLEVLPLGTQNRIALSSSWPHPSFGGTSPRTRDISADGFRAEWEIPGLASNAQQRFLMLTARSDASGVPPLSEDALSVSLVEPVDIYAKTDRASKYGILFVLLTFVGFFIFELTKQLPIHPIQYGLVGLALAIFFLLLLSLSEHIDFGWAYLVAAGACIGLIAFYLTAVLQSLGRALGFAGMLAMLYAALYGLLVSEDNALVLGAGLLFVILAGLMTITRRVDWYRIGAARPAVSPPA